MTEAVIFLAKGTEECEALLVVDILRRADIKIDMVSIEDTREIVGGHDICIICDATLDEYDLQDPKLLIVPGGLEGTNRMKASEPLQAVIKEHHEKSGLLAAVCAGPSVLGALDLLDGYSATAYPGFGSKLGKGATFQDEAVLQDKNLITARGLGASIPFALKIVSVLRDQGTADKLAEQIVYYN